MLTLSGTVVVTRTTSGNTLSTTWCYEVSVVVVVVVVVVVDVYTHCQCIVSSHCSGDAIAQRERLIYT